MIQLTLNLKRAMIVDFGYKSEGLVPKEQFALPDGRGMAKGLAYMYPFIANKKKWPLPPDVMFDKEWPVAQPCLLFAGLALGHSGYIDLWQRLDHDPTVDEVLRNWPVRQPVLWVK